VLASSAALCCAVLCQLTAEVFPLSVSAEVLPLSASTHPQRTVGSPAEGKLFPSAL